MEIMNHAVVILDSYNSDELKMNGFVSDTSSPERFTCGSNNNNNNLDSTENTLCATECEILRDSDHPLGASSKSSQQNAYENGHIASFQKQDKNGIESLDNFSSQDIIHANSIDNSHEDLVVEVSASPVSSYYLDPLSCNQELESSSTSYETAKESTQDTEFESAEELTSAPLSPFTVDISEDRFTEQFDDLDEQFAFDESQFGCGSDTILETTVVLESHEETSLLNTTVVLSNGSSLPEVYEPCEVEDFREVPEESKQNVDVNDSLCDLLGKLTIQSSSASSDDVKINDKLIEEDLDATLHDELRIEETDCIFNSEVNEDADHLEVEVQSLLKSEVENDLLNIDESAKCLNEVCITSTEDTESVISLSDISSQILSEISVKQVLKESSQLNCEDLVNENLTVYDHSTVDGEVPVELPDDNNTQPDWEDFVGSEAAHMVELFECSAQDSLQLSDDTFLTPMPSVYPKYSEHNKMEEVENNKIFKVETDLEGNINPFESKCKVGFSPPRDLTLDNHVRSKNGLVFPDTVSVKRKTGESRFTEGDASATENRDLSNGGDDAIQPCLMESSISEDSGIEVVNGAKVGLESTNSYETSNVTSWDSTSAINSNKVPSNFSEAGPDVAEYNQNEFRSATEFFDANSIDFLEKRQGNKFTESALSRMSLYVKFDPLVGNSQDSVANRRMTMWLKQQQQQEKLGEVETGDETITAPVDSSADETRLINLSESPVKLATVSSPGEANVNITTASTTGPVVDDEVRQMLKIQELLFQDRLLMKEKEWVEKMKTWEKENLQLNAQIRRLQDSQNQMRAVVGEYEKTMSQLIADREREKEESVKGIDELQKKHDQAVRDLQGVETAFADLHRRYEKAKAVVEGFKKNEEALTKCVADFQGRYKKQVDKYSILKNKAEETLQTANMEIECLRKTSDAEVAALKAQLKKTEMKVESLEKLMEQKTRENEELTNICDELIAKVGNV
ncbi:Transforming acidic coiled-coil-containing protein 3 [Chamberlinius hualienensis]